MLLSELISIPIEYDCPVTGLALDSRKVVPGDVFFALAGTQTHGEIYIETAIKKGAVAICKESSRNQTETLYYHTIIMEPQTKRVPCISIPHLSHHLGEISARFYGHPSHDLQVIGVTGTNGKTSTTHFIAQTLHTYAPCGLIGTLGYGTYGALCQGQHTTPDALSLQALLAQFKTHHIQKVVMEVSSHALAQGRVNGMRFEVAVLTNLSRDHLDYHHSMAAYGEAKRQLFLMPHLKTAVINYDDPFGQTLLNQLPHSVTPLTYSTTRQTADVFAKITQMHAQGCTLALQSPWGQGVLHSPLLGQFNVSNLLAAFTVLINLGLPFSTLLTHMSQLRPVAGRMERFGQAPHPTILVDYAHTPDALEKTLLALREHCHGQLWCVFGCGGNRDRGKRPLMGEIAQRYADKVILTDDNPRHENAQRIIEDILKGCPTPEAILSDRKQAIDYALHHATSEDLVLIAGKGHEDYQEIGDQRFSLSDRGLVMEWLSKNDR